MIKFILILLSISCFSNPYPWKEFAPQDDILTPFLSDFDEFQNMPEPEEFYEYIFESKEVLRVQVDWLEGEIYNISHLIKEFSGTEALYKSRSKKPTWGSYLATLKCGDVTYYDSVGTGRSFRILTRGMSFRFPMIYGECNFKLEAEDPELGDMNIVLEQKIWPAHEAKEIPKLDYKTYLLKESFHPNKLIMTIYAEGYKKGEEKQFIAKAKKAINALTNLPFPGVEYFEFRAVFAESNTRLGKAQDLGLPVPQRDSFLGLYHPYWAKDIMTRWYHIVYPTRQLKYRNAIGQVPYDYPLTIIKSSNYWGVGNYKELTAIPSNSRSFNYLLFHELGHYFGLNEEYSGGGRTELEFAYGKKRSWSQNLSFNKSGPLKKSDLKWSSFIDEETPLPTRNTFWNKVRFIYGAYTGGYADSRSFYNAYIPVKAGLCLMNSSAHFCGVCTKGIKDILEFDSGE